MGVVFYSRERSNFQNRRNKENKIQTNPLEKPATRNSVVTVGQSYTKSTQKNHHSVPEGEVLALLTENLWNYLKIAVTN